MHGGVNESSSRKGGLRDKKDLCSACGSFYDPVSCTRCAFDRSIPRAALPRLERYVVCLEALHIR